MHCLRRLIYTYVSAEKSLSDDSFGCQKRRCQKRQKSNKEVSKIIIIIVVVVVVIVIIIIISRVHVDCRPCMFL